MNSFYASVEMAYDPSLKGKPLAIAGNPEERRGIIVTCSYEARKFGVKTTMTLWEAKKLCPQLIVKRPNFERYRTASLGMFAILQQYSDLVEPVSIDEGYVDITEAQEFGHPLQIAKTIQHRIKEQLDLPCSIGIAPNKFLAKTASNMKKPMGITVLRKRDVANILWSLPAGEMHGVGKKTAEKLAAHNINTIGDIAIANELVLKSLLGINGIRLKERANGIDKRPVDPEAAAEFKSVGNSTTLPKDVANQQELLHVLENLSEKVAERLKRKMVLATSVSVMIRYKNRKTITRRKALKNPLYTKLELAGCAKEIFLKHWNGDAVRLLGVTGGDLIEKKLATRQLDLFSYNEEAKKEPLLETVEKLKEKYGKNIIEHAGDLHDVKKADKSFHSETSFSKDFLDQFRYSRKNDERDQ
ncbi:DNA polymerase IV [Bacillaceae bacterium Marseille-Q3522]|nr:DNA polymerase IV [Bacillaceae bacterium Marseille-Q3522]